MPSLHLLLIPKFDSAGAASAITVRMTFESPRKLKDDVVFHHVLLQGNVPTMQYVAEAIRLRDSSGFLPLYHQDINGANRRNFLFARDAQSAELVVEHEVTPRDVDENTKCGPQVDIQQDAGCLTGAGLYFLLIPEPEDTLFDITIEWDISSAPDGTRIVSTFGEGRKVSTKQKASVLLESYFAVGPLKSYPSDTIGSSFGMYWTSQPPFDAQELAKQMKNLAPRIAEFLGDDDPLYRIFLRRNVYRCISGRGLFKGFAFSWTPIVRYRESREEFLFHEIVHNWPREGGRLELDDGCFTEGVAEYYSLVLPYRFGIITEHEFVRRFNNHLSSYYTNPARNLLSKDIPSKLWQLGGTHRIPYQRGFMWFVQLAYQLHHAGGRSLDDLVRDMVKFRSTSQPHDRGVWLSMIETELGLAALEDYRNISNAKLIVLPEDILDAFLPGNNQWTLRRQDQEEFYLGFPFANLAAQPRVVKGLDINSRATKAGVCEGDAITSKYSFLDADAELYDRSFSMQVERKDVADGRERLLEFTWWPRTWDKVESYQIIAK